MFRRLVILVVCVFAVFITVPKLYTMCALRGWVPGAHARTYRVTQKLVTTKVTGTEDAHWISWNREDIRKIGHHRVHVPLERWQTINLADPIEIVTVGRDTNPFLRNDGFASGGNFVFDLLLLAAELWGIIGNIRWFLILRGDDMTL